MKKLHAWPEGHWDWPIKVSHKHGVRCGDMMWVGGQVDLTSAGEVRNSGDMAKQIPNCIESFGRVLRDLGGDLTDLVKLLCIYVNDGSVDETRFLETSRQGVAGRSQAGGDSRASALSRLSRHDGRD